jgi:hypothetical protein
MTGGQRLHDLVPDASPSPAHEAISKSWPIILREVAPRCTETQDPKDGIEHATVIYTPNAARLVRQHRFNGGPFKAAEFVARSPTLSWNHLGQWPLLRELRSSEGPEATLDLRRRRKQ